MELADPRLISQLTETTAAGPRRSTGPRTRKRKPPVEGTVYQAPAHKSRRCRCGTCAPCAENARWERIFAEKFADPSYYSDIPVRQGSPLHIT